MKIDRGWWNLCRIFVSGLAVHYSDPYLRHLYLSVLSEALNHECITFA